MSDDKRGRPIRHTTCGGIAFYYDGPTVGAVRSELATMPDGTKPSAGESMRCGACGKVIFSPMRELSEEAR